MGNELAKKFREDLAAIGMALADVPARMGDVPWRAGGWNRKQIVGHMLDSAANNRQRFVRAAIDGSYQGPTYGQQEWVAAHGYADQPWDTLLQWWRVEHEILAAVVDRVPAERMPCSCMVEGNAPATLQFLIEDYVVHQLWHLRQIEGSAEPA
jgi:hypothetical protein